MKTHGVLHINHIELDQNHKLTLNRLNKLGFLGNWVNTSNIPEIQVFKNDVEDVDHIIVKIYPEMLDIYTSFRKSEVTPKKWEELKSSFDHAVALIDKIYHKDSINLDVTDDYKIAE